MGKYDDRGTNQRQKRQHIEQPIETQRGLPRRSAARSADRSGGQEKRE